MHKKTTQKISSHATLAKACYLIVDIICDPAWESRAHNHAKIDQLPFILSTLITFCLKSLSIKFLPLVQ